MVKIIHQVHVERSAVVVRYEEVLWGRLSGALCLETRGDE